MVWLGQYYGPPFQGLCGVTQGDPLSPTILKMVMDDVIQHWVELVAGGGGGGQAPMISDGPSSGSQNFLWRLRGLGFNEFGPTPGGNGRVDGSI